MKINNNDCFQSGKMLTCEMQEYLIQYSSISNMSTWATGVGVSWSVGRQSCSYLVESETGTNCR